MRREEVYRQDPEDIRSSVHTTGSGWLSISGIDQAILTFTQLPGFQVGHLPSSVEGVYPGILPSYLVSAIMPVPNDISLYLESGILYAFCKLT